MNTLEINTLMHVDLTLNAMPIHLGQVHTGARFWRADSAAASSSSSRQLNPEPHQSCLAYNQSDTLNKDESFWKVSDIWSGPRIIKAYGSTIFSAVTFSNAASLPLKIGPGDILELNRLGFKIKGHLTYTCCLLRAKVLCS